jgi:hypothetical protein
MMRLRFSDRKSSCEPVKWIVNETTFASYDFVRIEKLFKKWLIILCLQVSEKILVTDLDNTQAAYSTLFKVSPDLAILMTSIIYGPAHIPLFVLTDICINKNVNVRLFKVLNLRKFFTDCFEILIQRCIRIRACFYVPILYRCAVDCLYMKSKVKVTLRLTVSQSVSLGVEPHLGLMTRYLLPFDSYALVFVGRPLWREDGSVFCQSHCLH